ncbi:MAG: amidohydrolase family protein, partial [Vicingaceae bacterium]
HLEVMEEQDIQDLIKSDVMPTLLPSCSFFLGIPYAPARRLIDSGLPVALATDFNPGSTPSGNVPFVLSLACINYKMTPEEAINASTINGAYAMGLNKTHGSIAIGKKANLFITKEISSVAFIPYSFGSNSIETVILNGKIAN